MFNILKCLTNVLKPPIQIERVTALVIKVEDWQFVESKFWLLQPLETLISRQELRFFTLTNTQIQIRKYTNTQIYQYIKYKYIMHKYKTWLLQPQTHS